MALDPPDSQHSGHGHSDHQGRTRGGGLAGHTHSHSSLRLASGSSTVGRALALVALAALVLTVVGMVVLRPTGPAPEAPGVTPGTIFVDGTVQSRTVVPCPDELDETVQCAAAEVRVTSGPTTGTLTTLQLTLYLPSTPDLEPGDRIRMSYFPQAPEGFEYTFIEYQRSVPLLVLAVLFVAAVILLSRLQGLRALIGMVLSLLVIIFYLLPALLRGGPPLPLAVVTAMAVAFLVLYLAHGIHSGTHVAFVGSVLALTVTGVLGTVFVHLASITGFSDETAATLTVAAGNLDLRGLLLAGLVIGALGVLDDVTVTQVSAVAELRNADPHASAYDLYRAGLRIGRDHVASTVNTLVLAYAGAALPLLLMFTQGGRSVVDVLTSEIVAIEIIRALVGSLGIIAAIPITTGLAALVVRADIAAGGGTLKADRRGVHADRGRNEGDDRRWWQRQDPFADMADMVDPGRGESEPVEPKPVDDGSTEDGSPDADPIVDPATDDDIWTSEAGPDPKRPQGPRRPASPSRPQSP